MTSVRWMKASENTPTRTLTSWMKLFAFLDVLSDSVMVFTISSYLLIAATALAPWGFWASNVLQLKWHLNLHVELYLLTNLEQSLKIDTFWLEIANLDNSRNSNVIIHEHSIQEPSSIDNSGLCFIYLNKVEWISF